VLRQPIQKKFIKCSWDSNADPAIPLERRKAGDLIHSVPLINACNPGIGVRILRRRIRRARK